VKTQGPRYFQMAGLTNHRDGESCVMDDKVKIRCPACKQVFREKANIVRDGAQLNCPNCCKLLTLNRDTNDPYFRRALKLAKEIRKIAQAQIIEKAYGPGALDGSQT
jgi:hypothetical protein